jgi:uncharacterized membrane protein
MDVRVSRKAALDISPGRQPWVSKDSETQPLNSRLLNAALLTGATLWCFGIIAAPVFQVAWIYRFFAIICHQDPARSWQLFGNPLPVCIRCASIYFAFTASLWLGLRTNVRWLRIALVFMLAEFVAARLIIDTAFLRSLSGILVGSSAAPFVKQGVEELRDSL